MHTEPVERGRELAAGVGGVGLREQGALALGVAGSKAPGAQRVFDRWVHDRARSGRGRVAGGPPGVADPSRSAGRRVRKRRRLLRAGDRLGCGRHVRGRPVR